MKTLVTHNGLSFHADEITAIALLQIFKNDNYNIIRTRDINEINKADIVVDVGGIYNTETMRFDHHHFDRNHELYGKSSAGLVWEFLGLADTYPEITSFVSQVDKHDTGIEMASNHSVISLVSSFNAETPKEADELFNQALDIITTYLKNLKNKEEKQTKINEAIKTALYTKHQGIKTVVLHKDTIFVPANNFIDKAEMVISWDTVQSCWSYQVVNVAKDSFDLPFKILNIEDKIFVHPNGFIAKSKKFMAELEVEWDMDYL